MLPHDPIATRTPIEDPGAVADHVLPGHHDGGFQFGAHHRHGGIDPLVGARGQRPPQPVDPVAGRLQVDPGLPSLLQRGLRMRHVVVSSPRSEKFLEAFAQHPVHVNLLGIGSFANA